MCTDSTDVHTPCTCIASPDLAVLCTACTGTIRRGTWEVQGEHTEDNLVVYIGRLIDGIVNILSFLLRCGIKVSRQGTLLTHPNDAQPHPLSIVGTDADAQEFLNDLAPCDLCTASYKCRPNHQLSMGLHLIPTASILTHCPQLLVTRLSYSSAVIKQCSQGVTPGALISWCPI